MRNLFILLMVAGILALGSTAIAAEFGANYHITGCEKGELLVRVINVWNKPGGVANGALPIGIMSGDGRADQGLKCQGSIVKILDTKVVNDRRYYKIESIINGRVGWVSYFFIGRKAL